MRSSLHAGHGDLTDSKLRILTEIPLQEISGKKPCSQRSILELATEMFLVSEPNLKLTFDELNDRLYQMGTVGDIIKQLRIFIEEGCGGLPPDKQKHIRELFNTI